MTTLPSLPEYACDCHVHVFESPARYPFSPTRPYTPGTASLDDLKKLHTELGIRRAVIVQASPHGADNRCMLDSLDRLEGAGRGVAVIDEHIAPDELRQMHARGVRGVRINLETAGERNPAAARAALQRTAARVADLGWHVQVYTDLNVLRELVDLLPQLPVPLVVDHFARAMAKFGTTQTGFRELCDALAQNYIYVKLSAPYRISSQPGYPDAAPLARELIQANPDRVLWGSDWPHPGAAAGALRPPSEITPFRHEDNTAALARAMSWTSDAEQQRKLFSLNAQNLYAF